MDRTGTTLSNFEVQHIQTSRMDRKAHTGRISGGVTFRNLFVYGSGSSKTVQQTPSTFALSLIRQTARLFSNTSEAKPCILRNFNGSIGNGEMLLVLGRPGSGCSTFLKVLAGQTRGLVVAEVSEIDYDGIAFSQMSRLPRGDLIYLAELDVHFPELAVGQTLEFVAATKHDGYQLSSPLMKARSIATQLNLVDSFDTKIGNAMIRGCSGGEKRRTSIAEVLMIQSPFQFWDNSTRGLDSSTALNFVQRIRDAASRMRSTVAMSMYQTSDAIYEQFDKVTLLYEGHQIYFGPAASAAQYFKDLGFHRPTRTTTADFLTSITNPKERQIRAGFESIVPRSPADFAEAWRKSELAHVLGTVDQKNKEQNLAQSSMSDRNSPRKVSLAYVVPLHIQVWLCIKRGFQRLRNNYVPTIAGILGNTVISFVVSSVYFDLEESAESLDKRAVLIFFSLVINAYAPAFEIMIMWAQRPIVEKHNRYALYYPFTESIAALVCDIPNKIATCVMFNTVIYFMTNLRRTADAFFTYMIFVFILIVTMSLFFRMVGSLSRTIEQTMVPVSMVILVFSAYTGFIIPARDMVPWLSWLRHLNPIAFAYESLMINEFAGRNFPCSRFIPDGLAYTNISPDHKICAVIGSQIGRQDVDGSQFILSKYGFETNHLWRNMAIIISMLVIFFTIHILAAQYIPARSSRGEILVFRQRGKSSKQPQDEEMVELCAPSQINSGQSLTADQVSSHGVEKSSEVNEGTPTFHWSNVNYTIQTKHGTRHILKDVEGWINPGTLTALMGVTGAGKTTLLDILACRNQVGVVTGDIFIGNSKRDKSFQRKTGYVQQEDIHLPTTTVREALQFSAALRQSEAHDRSHQLDHVEEILDTLEMSSYAEAVVGVTGEGLNIEQRKRLSIAIEMVAKPELLIFLDEPTSGLDSQTAWDICMLLRKLCNKGQSILVTIHQPSSKLFQIFDRLLLLGEAGRMLYFGEIGLGSSALINYFETNGASLCKPGQNPAEWILDITKNANTAEISHEYHQRDWYDVWSESPQRREVLLQIQKWKQKTIQVTGPGTEISEREFAATFPRQLYCVVERVFQQYWRDPMYLFSKAALCAGVTLCNGLSFSKSELDVQRISNVFFSVFLFTQLFSTLDQQIIPRLTSGRALFEARERRSKTYSWIVMLAAHILVELFWQTLTAILIFVTWWYPTSLWKNSDPTFNASERAGLAFGVIWLFNLWISTFSQTVAVGIDHEETAVQIATLFFWLSLVFCGILVPPGELPRFWKFVYRASPITYFIHGSATAGLANMAVNCSDIEFLHIMPPTNTTCGSYMDSFISQSGGWLKDYGGTTDCLFCPIQSTNSVLEIYGVHFQDRWHNFGYLSIYVAFNIVATFAIYWVFREKKLTAS